MTEAAAETGAEAEPAGGAPATRHLARWTVGAALGLTLVVTFLLTGRSPAQADGDLVAEGRQLYLVGCVSCHGTQGQGVKDAGDNERGPSLEEAGEAAAYYYLSTGRMPLGNPDEQPHRKDPAYDEHDIAALVAYVGSLGDGPALPAVDLDGASLSRGGKVFRANCQACHSASGSGGALSYGRAAPALSKAEPEQVAGAVRAGPGQMPVFGPSTISDEQLDDLVTYVEYLKAPEDPGGVPLGRIGPVPEGFVAWFVGVTALLACVFWIGTRSPIRRRKRS
ncbi:c-type cytochrome [Aquihabitans sp. G128]|uniref:cytochrome bc1 complex diheme cytochrome c subunit n=1 Tax=Aquihabitans sp. G128 TaxID=2849779 RepID=UPI001C240A56|nr:c-type cytochrome [Aquihabitans sp. G128]QXC61533.1 c-type cytochrome [Aquihabitans sp. G128]